MRPLRICKLVNVISPEGFLGYICKCSHRKACGRFHNTIYADKKLLKGGEVVVVVCVRVYVCVCVCVLEGRFQ